LLSANDSKPVHTGNDSSSFVTKPNSQCLQDYIVTDGDELWPSPMQRLGESSDTYTGVSQ